MIIEHKIKKTLSIPITCSHKYYLPLLNVENSIYAGKLQGQKEFFYLMFYYHNFQKKIYLTCFLIINKSLSHIIPCIANFARFLFKDEDVKCQMYDEKLFCFFSSTRHFCHLDRGSRFHIKWVVLGFMFSRKISHPHNLL